MVSTHNLRFLVFVLAATSIVSFMTGCATSIKNEHIDTKIRIERTGTDEWTVDYQFSKPIQVFKFSKQIAKFRVEHWKSLASTHQLKEQNGTDLIFFKQPTTSAKFVLKTWTEVVPADFDAFSKFEDGGRLVYSGYFTGEPVNSQLKSLGTENRSQFIFGPRSGEIALEIGNDAYVYFGQTRPAETPMMTILLDGGLPSWLKHATLEELPILFDFYKQKFGIDISFRPFIIVSSNGFSTVGTSISGSARNGVILVTIWGKNWQTSNPELQRKYFGFLAHEAAHFWNGGIFNPFGDSMWLHEGGATALADRTLLALGEQNKKEFLEKQSQLLNSCFDELNGKPIFKNPGRSKRYGPSYSCGSIIWLITESLIRRSNPETDLFFFWNQMFKKTKNHQYGEAEFTETLNEILGNNIPADNLIKLIHQSSANGADSFLPILENSGIKIRKINRLFRIESVP